MAMEKNAKVVWHGNMAFTATGSTAPGHTIALDADGSVGGEGNGFRPIEMFAVGLAGCTAMDVISILRKKKQDVTAFEVDVRAAQVDAHPKVFDRITIHYRITGRDISPKAVARAIELSESKYCPATAMLRQGAAITSEYEIIEADRVPDLA